MRCIHPVLPGRLTLSDGRTIELVEPIGRGTYGVVHRGILEGSWGVRRPVAVKLFHVERDDDPSQLLRRLARIARRATCVRHASFVQVLDVDRTSDPRAPQPYLVTELVHGESLATLLASWRESGHRVPLDFALVVLAKAAEALGAALFAEDADGGLSTLVHGDVSPRQILISDLGEVKIGDFAQPLLRDRGSQIRSRSSLTFVAPELVAGLEATPRSDVFSLGMILHEMLVGPRFAPGTDIGTAVEMVRQGTWHMALIEPNLPREIRAILDRATMPDPMDRYPHARAMAFDLRRELLRLGLCDAQTSVRQSVVGWCEVRTNTPSDFPVAIRQKSDVVSKAVAAPRTDAEDTAPEIRAAKLRR